MRLHRRRHDAYTTNKIHNYIASLKTNRHLATDDDCSVKKIEKKN